MHIKQRTVRTVLRLTSTFLATRRSVYPLLNQDLHAKGCNSKNVTESLNLCHTLVMESPDLGPRVKLFKSFTSLNALTLGPSLRDSITKVWPEIERLSHIFDVTPYLYCASPAHFNSSMSIFITVVFQYRVTLQAHPLFVCNAKGGGAITFKC